MTNKPLQRRAPLHQFNNCRVVTDARVETEITTVGLTQTDALYFAVFQPGNKLCESNHRVVGKTKCAHEDVCRTTRQHCERGVAAGQTRGHFIQGSVATESHNGVEPPRCRILGKTGCMAALVGLHHLHVVVTGKVLVDQHRVSGSYRRGERVDNQQYSQEGNFTSADGYPCHRRINRGFGLGQSPTHR